MAQSRLGILLTAKNNASGQINQVSGDLDQMKGTTSGVTAGLGALAKAVVAVGLVDLGRRALLASADLSRLSVETANLRASFDDLAANAGQSGDKMLQAMRKASRGMIADSELILSANRAMMLGVADSSEEMTALMDIAGARGQAMGLSLTQAFNDIVTGLGRGSALILDNLGIVIDVTQANENYAASLDKAADELTEVEKKQALVNAVIADSADITGAAENPFERASASISNLRVAIGDFINEATGFPQLLNNIADAADNVTQSIQSGIKAEAEKDLGSVGDTVTRLADEYQRQADRMREAGLGGDAEQLQDASNRMEILRVAIQSAGEEYNEAAAKTGAPLLDIGLLQQGIVAFADMERNIEAAGDAAAAAEPKIINMGLAARAAAEGFDVAMNRQRGFVRALQQDASGLVETMGPEGALKWVEQQSDQLSKQVRLWQDQGFTVGEINNTLLPSYLSKLDDGVDKLTKSGDATNQQSKLTKALQQDASRLVEVMGPQGALGWIEKQNDAIGTQVRLWQDQGFTTEEINSTLLPSYLAQLDDGVRKLTDTESATKKVSEAAKELEREFNKVVSKVEGVLRGALSLDLGDVDTADFLPREDAINENARRLADIMVNGISGQDWLGEFKREVPDLFQALTDSGDPQTAAAKMLREFEAGMRPELIDKEAAKERIRTMLLGDQNLAEMAQEIAAELAAEMPQFSGRGISGLVNQVLGVKGDDIASGLAAGEAYAQGAVGAVSEEAPGTAMVRALNNQLAAESNLALIRTSGSQAGTAWGNGFLQNVEAGVPTQLITILATLITPAVQAGLRVEDQLTGAAE